MVSKYSIFSKDFVIQTFSRWDILSLMSILANLKNICEKQAGEQHDQMKTSKSFQFPKSSIFK